MTGKAARQLSSWLSRFSDVQITGMHTTPNHTEVSFLPWEGKRHGQALSRAVAQQPGP